MRALVTGATGFVGAAAVAALRERGHTVRALVRDASSEEARAQLARSGAECIAGDLSNERSLSRALTGVDAVVHAATRRCPAGALAGHEALNVVGTENLLAAARRAGVPRFVFVSTEAVTAGYSERGYVDEGYALAGGYLTPYARTMALAEDLVVAAGGERGLTTVALRPGWLWGPAEDVLLPAWVRRARAGTLVLPGGGEGFVPTTHIANLASAIALGVTVEAARPSGNLYQLTDDERISVRLFLAKLLAAAGVQRGPRSGLLPFPLAYALAWVRDRAAGEGGAARAETVALGRAAYFNLARARDELGYEPVMNVARGMQELSAWAARVGGAEAIAKGAPYGG